MARDPPVRVNDLADKLRSQGLTVVETAGCWTRGYDFPDRPPGKIRHWTAGPILGETPCLAVCTHGRAGLPGPLCNVYQSRRVDGNGLDVVYLVATGKANHAGTGIWNGHSGNYEFLGLEIEWAGPTERFVGVRRREETSLRVMRALHAASSGRAADACEHREYATPRGRKQDTDLDGNALRRDIATPTGDDLTPDESRMLKTLYDVFASPDPNNGPGDKESRVSKVLDNAMWTRERIAKAENQALAATMFAAAANEGVKAIMEHLGIELPAPPPETPPG